MTASLPLLRLLQLTSPALPVGGFAYSRGLEWAVERSVRDEASAGSWLFGVLEHGLARLDVPVLARMHRAWADDDADTVRRWSARLLASRETAEFRQEELQTGGALARLLRDLGMPGAGEWVACPRRTFAALFALAGARWGIETGDLCAAFLFAWAESQVAAAIKLVPLGQTAGQRLLVEAGTRIPGLTALGLSLDENEIGGTVPGQVMASALHETQRTRLFRS